MTKAAVCIAEDAVTLIADRHLLALRQLGRVEVWNALGEIHLGNLPIYVTDNAIREAAEFWINGYAAGLLDGRDEAQAKLRAALGLSV